jgi:3-hydroxybutyryl-CoA dehydrogenase
MKVENVAVIGAGLMGSGIAQVSALAGRRVKVYDNADLARGESLLDESLARFVKKGTLTEVGAIEARARIEFTADFAYAVSDCDIAVEAVFEKLEVKQDIFRRLDEFAPVRSILASNTSALPITQIASVVKDPTRVVGTHFFSPVPMMRLCELVRGQETSDETLQVARNFAESIGKECIVVNRDIAGFVTTRLILTLVLEAARLVESGIATAADVDLACKLGFGHAMGPLATADLTGIDVLRNASLNIVNEGETIEAAEHFLPPALINDLVAQGKLGRKSGSGFHTY